MTASLQQLTWLASAPFRAQHQPGIRPVITGPRPESRDRLRACSRRLSAAGIRFLAILSRLVFRPSYDRPTAPAAAARTMTGFPCSARVRRGRVRAPSIPRGQRCLHGHVCVPCPPPAALQRPVPVTPVSRPVPECLSHEASARVHWRSPLPAIPLACGPRTEREPLGFPPGFTPG